QRACAASRGCAAAETCGWLGGSGAVRLCPYRRRVSRRGGGCGPAVRTTSRDRSERSTWHGRLHPRDRQEVRDRSGGRAAGGEVRRPQLVSVRRAHPETPRGAEQVC